MTKTFITFLLKHKRLLFCIGLVVALCSFMLYNICGVTLREGLSKKGKTAPKKKIAPVKKLSKKQQAAGKKKGTFRDKWSKAVKTARKELTKEGMDLRGFIPIGGKTKEGKALLKRTREIMN